MNILKKNGIIIFWVLLFLDCYFVFMQKTSNHAITKILLIPVLAFYIFLNARKKHFIRTKTIVFLGLTCAWIGDILLLQKGDAFFMAGMIAFLATHIFYSIFFYRAHGIGTTASYETVIVAALIMLGMFYFVHGIIKDELALLPYFKIPIYIYSIALGSMAVLAANLFSNRSTKNISMQFFIPGAFLFVASDATLALHKFQYIDVDFLDVIVMITYGYAQCLIGQGFAKYLKG